MQPITGTRTKTIAWEDPAGLVAAGARMSGADFMQALVDGTLPPPPIAVLMGFALDEVSEGRAVFVGQPGEEHYNPIGVVHGGLAATLLDSAMGCAVQTVLPEGTAYGTIEIKVNYVRSMRIDTGPVEAVGTVIHAGATTALAEGRLTARSTGKLLAHATTTCFVRRPAG